MAEKESNHSYLVKSVLRSTAVQHAVAGSFTGPGASEVVLAKVSSCYSFILALNILWQRMSTHEMMKLLR